MRTPVEVAHEFQVLYELCIHRHTVEPLAEAIAARDREVQLALLKRVEQLRDELFEGGAGGRAWFEAIGRLRAELQQDDGKRPLESVGGIGGE